VTSRTTVQQPFRAALPAVILVAMIFFLNFISRVVMAPLMPVVQQDIGFTHAGAGYLFLALAGGNAFGLLLNCVVSRAMSHRKTVAFSAFMTGSMALAIPLAEAYAVLLVSMFGLGIAAGLYLPSGIAVVTSLVRSGDWGKTMAMHELAPALSFVVAPLLAEAALFLLDWRSVFTALGSAQVLMGLWFSRAGRGGEFPGLVPGPAVVTAIVKRPVFWLLVLFFSLAIGSAIGPYSMLPLYLVDSHGYSRTSANQLLSYSRILACFMPFLAGWITDRRGPKPAIGLFLGLTGSALVLLGVASGPLLVAVALMEPLFTVFMFAPGFTMLSMSFPPEQRSIAVALAGPFNALLGMGLIPTFLGHMGDLGRFDMGFLILGGVLLSGLSLLPFLPEGTAGKSGS